MTNNEARREYEDWKGYFNDSIIGVTDVMEENGYTVYEGYGKEDGDWILFHEKREGSMVKWMIEEYKFFEPHPEMPRFLFEEQGEFIEDLPCEQEWMVEYDVVGGRPMRINVFRDVDEAREFTLRVKGTVFGMTPVTEDTRTRKYFAL